MNAPNSHDPESQDVSWKVLELKHSVTNDHEEFAFLCKLCLENFPSNQNKFSLESCGCFFCIECMTTYLEVLINDGVVLSLNCPDSECAIQGNVSPLEIMQLTSVETYEKYKRLKFEQEVAIDPHQMFCPRAGCATVCHICHRKKQKSQKQTTQPNTNPIKVYCNKCELHFCSICKVEWPNDNHSCVELTASLSSEIMRLQTRAGLALSNRSEPLIKRCPVCQVLIEKDRGCAQMICRSCSHVFCWNCLKLLDNDFMLHHYDKGPCKNFLGHSRAQVMRHRLGVIGLFSAFTLLLIVASPVLILAAPVLLCCKCKDCCKKLWRRDDVSITTQNINQSTQTYRKVSKKSNNLSVPAEVFMEEGSLTSQSSTTMLNK